MPPPKTNRQLPEFLQCTHDDRPVYARGACRTCYWQAYANTDQGRAVRLRAATSEKGRARILRARLKHNKTPKRRAYARKVIRSLKGRAPGEHERAEAKRPYVTICACCGSPDPRTALGWHADHNHQTGIFRAHLCQPCNLMLGYFEKYDLNPLMFTAYLKRFAYAESIRAATPADQPIDPKAS